MSGISFNLSYSESICKSESVLVIEQEAMLQWILPTIDILFPCVHPVSGEIQSFFDIEHALCIDLTVWLSWLKRVEKAVIPKLSRTAQVFYNDFITWHRTNSAGHDILYISQQKR